MTFYLSFWLEISVEQIVKEKLSAKECLDSWGSLVSAYYYYYCWQPHY